MTDGSDANESNRLAFSSEATIADYAATSGLTPAEERLFDRYVPDGSRVLDLGVGAGRTTPRLSTGAARYVGIDVSEAMVDRRGGCTPAWTWPSATLPTCRPTMTRRSTSWCSRNNGLDYLHPDTKRRACLTEIATLTAPGGTFLFSVHNPRCLLRPPARPLSARTVAVAGYQTVRRMIGARPHRCVLDRRRQRRRRCSRRPRHPYGDAPRRRSRDDVGGVRSPRDAAVGPSGPPQPLAPAGGTTPSSGPPRRGRAPPARRPSARR